MIKHIVSWKLKSSLTTDEKTQIKLTAKKQLESLHLDVIKELQLIIDPLDTSNVDMLLISSFESIEDLNTYATHPLHIEIAQTCIIPYTESRSCMDYQE